MKFKPYPKYKDSGIEWLGMMPERWDMKRADWITSTERETVSNELFAGQEVFHYSIPSVQEIGDGKYMLGDDIESGKSVIRKPMLLVSRLNPRKNTITRAYPKDVLTICSGEFVGLVPEHCDLVFLEYVYNSEPVRQLLNSRVRSVTKSHQRVEPEEISRLFWCSPPLSEQRAIALFLDRETGRIDELIGKKERQIELLQEKRQALISRAVTKGLDPTAKLKDSAIEWLGMVPEGWEVWKTAHGYEQIGSGTTPKSDNPEYYDGKIPWVTTGELRESVINDTAIKVTQEALQDYGTLRLYPAGTLLIAMYGATIGRLGILGVPATVNQACCAFGESEVFSNSFFYYWLQYRKPILISLSSGGGQPNLSQEDLRMLRVPLPTVAEQRAIASFLDRETGRIDELIAKIRASIEKLHEYRTALISAAVTGKIDVREDV